jgi:SAM-dependent methyltransferase
MLDLLRQNRVASERPVILVIGGGTVGGGLDDLYNAVDIDILAFDIYWSPFTQFMADAHRIPLADAAIDGVVIQAVLEHVLEPKIVVDQIHRVLKPDGLIYADTLSFSTCTPVPTTLLALRTAGIAICSGILSASSQVWLRARALSSCGLSITSCGRLPAPER